MAIDFNFKKERKLGDIVQDFINLLRLVLGHFLRTIIRLSIIPLCGMLLLIYYGTTKINLTAKESWTSQLDILFVGIGILIVLLVVSMVFFGLAIEYFILLKNRKSLDFGSRDVLSAFKGAIGKYLTFLPIAIIALIILAIPLFIAMGLLVFIPFVGSFAAGILASFVGVWFFCAFMFYREGYMTGTGAIPQTFPILKKKIFDYSAASYLVSFVFQILLMMLMLMPSILLAVIAYNTIGFEQTFFDSLFGRMLVSVGGTIVILLYIIYYMFSVLVSGIIYETAKEIRYGEDVYEQIANLGKEAHAH